ncbi:ras guanine nucleotide exchange factor domain-containing protein [Radiomyces spectabilis]|uniref:ras guanine nucleotide exchange factor domain-containing protein n=1 Tax=Radiomyces spectabilis TaxID=64574 RepID=UPI00221E8307|nr:ras guanine nucleotide exchange factor domain-containing protein [Radiomyces spectabilis]KAI8374367.1 ras guanine nucleotide exchange factor domain-containing protein [Radiomyces spectabilis]
MLWFTRKFTSFSHLDRCTNKNKLDKVIEEDRNITAPSFRKESHKVVSKSRTQSTSYPIITPSPSSTSFPSFEASYTIAIVGARFTGKTTFLQKFAYVQENDNTFTIVMDQTRYIVKEYDENMIIDASTCSPENLEGFGAVIVCYDTTDRNSIDCLPDILDIFVSRDISCVLLGLKTELTAFRQVNMDLVYDLANVFGTDVIEEDHHAVFQHIARYLNDSTTRRGMACSQPSEPCLSFTPCLQLDQHEELQNLGPPLDKLATINSCTTSEHSTESDDHHRHSFLSTSSVDNNTVNNEMGPPLAYFNRRRGSKDSSYSTGTGLTVDDIIDKVLSAGLWKSGDENIVSIFITFFRKFMRPSELVHALIERFEQDMTKTVPTRQQERIRSIFCLWLSKYWGDFHSSETRQSMILFLDKISKIEGSRPICDTLAPLAVREPPLHDPDASWGLTDINSPQSHKHNEKKDSGYSEGIDLAEIVMPKNCTEETPGTKTVHDGSPDAVFAGGVINIPLEAHSPNQGFISAFISSRSEKDLTAYKYLTFMEIPAQVMAEQLTWVEAELFRRIKPRDFVRHIWSSSDIGLQKNTDRSTMGNPVLASIAHFNFISAWVAAMIVAQHKLARRAAVFERFLCIAVQLRNHNNYNTLMALLAGINSAAILRLKQTRGAVSVKKIYKQLQSLECLMSSNRSFSSYRLALKASETPGIPYLGIHNQDLVSLSEANKDFKNDGTIHWEKFRLMGETIMGVLRFQYPNYTIQPNHAVLRFVADCEIMTEDERYQRSIMVEPRLKASSSTSRLRDLWMRV